MRGIEFLKGFSLPGLVLIISVLCGCTSSHPSTQPAAITGTVIGRAIAHDGSGVDSTIVAVTTGGNKPQTLASSQTDEDGAFVILDVPPGIGLVVAATHQGTVLVESASKGGVSVQAGKSTNVGSIELKAHPK